MKLSFPEFSNAHISKAVDICADLGVVSIASVVLPALLDKPQAFMMASGLVVAAMLWIIAFWLITLKS